MEVTKRRKPVSGSIRYSIRRHFVDGFFLKEVAALEAGGRVLDLGGNRTGKRGVFDIEKYDLEVIYGNLSDARRPDVLLDAVSVPFVDSSVDAVICSELLEHVSEPKSVLTESYRVLQQSGVLLISVPFLFHIHGDPKDYGRYTDSYWAEMLADAGFKEIEIRKQGLFWSVLMEMVRSIICHLIARGRISGKLCRHCLSTVVYWGMKKALEVDARQTNQQDPFLASFTTGFGIKAVKA